MEYKAYAGIGSRRTPSDIQKLMSDLSRSLGYLGYTLRSGGADGADNAFLSGSVIKYTELYLPWPTYNIEYRNDWPGVTDVLTQPSPDAYWYNENFHPAGKLLKRGVKKLMARNAHIILGEDLDTPVKFVICWTPDGSLDGYGPDCGGTGQALRIAYDLDIPVINLASKAHRGFAKWCIDNDRGFDDQSETRRIK